MSKDDIWDTKNWFRNEVSRIITENNLQCHTMEELEQVVLTKVKELIQREVPYSGFVDGPWKIYSKRISDQRVQSISQGAIAQVK